MWQKKAAGKTNGYGVTRIIRDSYSTVNGFTRVNSWWSLRKQAFDRDGGHCVVCKLDKRLVKAVDVHHIVSLNRGGANVLSNLISLCECCHNKRHNHLFRARKPK